MKTKKFAIAALAATVLFASCSKENNAVIDNTPGKPASLTIGINAPTRAAGVLTDGSDNSIGCFKAYVFRGEVLEAIITSADGTSVSETSKVTTKADALYVIANANTNSILGAVTEGTTTKTAFLALADNLLSSGSLNILESGKVWASSAAVSLAGKFTESNNYTATESVTVKPVTARINLTIDDQRTNTAAANAFVLTNTQVLNVAGKALFVSGTPAFTPVWYTGYAGGLNAAATVMTYFNDTYSSTGHMFYAFENDGATYPTIITLVASNDGGTTLRYFPVQFTTTDAGYVIERGHSYQAKVTLTGDATTDPDIDDPEDEVVPVNMTVSVSASPWVMVSDIEKTF